MKFVIVTSYPMNHMSLFHIILYEMATNDLKERSQTPYLRHSYMKMLMMLVIPRLWFSPLIHLMLQENRVFEAKALVTWFSQIFLLLFPWPFIWGYQSILSLDTNYGSLLRQHYTGM